MRKSVRGDESRPRVCVFRSHKHIYAQIIDDDAGRTLCASDSRKVCGSYGGAVEHAEKVGADLGDKATSLSIKQVKFDRGRYRYHGRIRALADAMRKKGMEF